MATKYSRKHQRTVLIITIVLCAAVLAATLFVTINSYVNTSPLFSDQDFAKAIADQLGVSPRNLTQEMLNDYEYIRITAMFTQPTADSPFVVYPLCTLGNSQFTDRIISEAEAEAEAENDEDESDSSDTSSAASSDTSSDTFYLDNSISFYVMLTDAEDLKLFPNLRYVSILSSYDVYNIEYNATLYSYYNQYYGGDSFDAESIISALSLSDINNLQAFSSNPRIEYLSLANSSVNSLNGIASLPSLKVLDLSNSALSDISSVGSAGVLEELFLTGTGVKDFSALSEAK